MKTTPQSQNTHFETGQNGAKVRTLRLDPQPIKLPKGGGTITLEEWHRQMAAYRAVHPSTEPAS